MIGRQPRQVAAVRLLVNGDTGEDGGENIATERRML